MKPAFFAVLICLGACSASDNATNPTNLAGDTLAVSTVAERSSSAAKTSNFRKGVRLERLYRQDVGEGPWTTWFGRLDERQAGSRDIYLETSERLTAAGTLSFDCEKPVDTSVTWKSYEPAAEYGNGQASRSTRISGSDLAKWKAGSLASMADASPPYALYVIVRSKYC